MIRNESANVFTKAVWLLFICRWPLVSTALSASRLREVIHQNQRQNRAILLPGVHDALSASIFAQAGAPALFLSGFGVSASHWSVPDAGILNGNDMEDAARRVISAVNSNSNSPPPVLVDGDTGYGGAINMRRAIRGLASAGASAVSIEDQAFPKRCTYIAATSGNDKPAGPTCVSREASLARIQTTLAAAKEAHEKDGNDVWIIGRTDGRLSLGFVEVLARCQEYERLGAHIVYAENLQSPQEYQRLREAISVPMMLAQVQLQDPKQKQQQQSAQHLYSLDDVSNLGYNFGLFGVTALQATVAALQSVAGELLSTSEVGGGRPGIIKDQHLSSFANLKEIVGYPDLEAFEQAYPCE